MRMSTGRRVAVQSALLTLVPAIVIAVFAKPLLTFLFGTPYAVAAPIVVLLMISTVPGAAAVALSLLAAVTDPRRFAIASGSSLVVNVVVNLILIPPFSGVGAGVAMVISQTYLVAAFYWVLWRKSAELNVAAGATGPA
jgi:O-antigen/teichoic acid export membrane protein